MTVAEFEEIKRKVLRQLEDQLPENLTYHNASHTADVLEQAQYIAQQEGFTNEEEIMLLKIAALFHDTGFLKVYKNHEAKGCAIVRVQMQHIFDEAALEKICGLIMATKIPQKPLTPLEEIICDADLDYLGREDFGPISNALRLEFLANNIVKNDREWQEKQISFFEQHKYFTATSNSKRNSRKQERLQELKTIFSLQYGL
ncbi:HD domain-containing protein [Panacibacter ginsenosidivorans]|uniref:HD domain-containing protein n=1 Tax=Panacibacter ginsenosidivorans TaxID=1813871 RepID=A0A5B8VAK3_9BACT|nr:HD domain-containing protein [Panacibacter ginsenosidivorans]QEC68382.1 HD domain-containing protein [Panacibacter ginsenosidivorans]